MSAFAIELVLLVALFVSQVGAAVGVVGAVRGGQLYITTMDCDTTFSRLSIEGILMEATDVSLSNFEVELALFLPVVLHVGGGKAVLEELEANILELMVGLSHAFVVALMLMLV